MNDAQNRVIRREPFSDTEDTRGWLLKGGADTNNRRHLRLKVSLEGHISSSKVGRLGARLSDLSITGCRVESPIFVIVGSYLTVTITGLAPAGATVCWCDNKTIGLRFNRPFDARVLDRLASS